MNETPVKTTWYDMAIAVIFSLALFIAGVLLAVDTVYAENMDTRDVTYIEGILDGVDNYDALEEDMTFIYNNFPYFVHFHQEYFDIILFTSDASVASRHYNVSTVNDLPDLNYYYIWGFRGSQDRMYITGYDTSFTMANAVTNPHTTNSKNEKIFEVQLVVQNYYDLNTPKKTASLGCFCFYDDDMLNWNFTSDLYNLETGLSQGSYNFNFNYFSNGDCRQNWVTSSTGNTYQYPFQLRGWNGTQYIFNGSYDYLDLVNEEIYTNHKTWIAEGNSVNSSTVYGWLEPNIEYPANNNTDGFRVYKSTEYGTDYLICDFSTLIEYGGWYTVEDREQYYTYRNVSDLTLAINVNGTTVQYLFDSTNNTDVYYYGDDDFYYAYYKIPISNFGFTDGYAYLENVALNNVTTVFGGVNVPNSFYWVTPITLFGVRPNEKPDFTDEDLEEILDTTTTFVPVTEETWFTNKTYVNIQTPQDIPSWASSLRVAFIRNSTFTEIVAAGLETDMQTWLSNNYDLIIVTPAIIQRDTFAPFYEHVEIETQNDADDLLDVIQEGLAFMGYDINLDIFHELLGNEQRYTGYAPTMNLLALDSLVSTYLGDYVFQLSISSYDVIKFDVVNFVIEQNNTLTKAVISQNQFFTTTYWQHANIFELEQIQLAVEGQSTVIKGEVEMLDKYLKHMDNLMIQYFPKLDDINNSVNNMANVIKNLLQKILEAIQNLNLNVPPTDLTPVTTKLDTIITKLDNSNLNNDWYKKYRNWLYKEDDTDNILTPHEYFIQAFDDVTSLYSMFAVDPFIYDTETDEDVATGWWADMRRLISYLKGDHITDNNDLNMYLYDGIDDLSFNLNDNNNLTWGDIQQ